MKRTDEQKQAFVNECLEIEKANGDVLGYIEVNWPSYTPRATVSPTRVGMNRKPARA